MAHKLLRILALMVAFAPAAQARVDGYATTSLFIPAPTRADASATNFADQIAAIIDTRTSMVDRTAPQPTADCQDPTAITRRLAALADLDDFTRTTVNGLIDAAPTLELRAATSEQLMPVLIHYRQEMTATLTKLMELPLAREKSALGAAIVRLADQAARP